MDSSFSMHAEYLKRINKVLHFIDNNLEKELTLQKLAYVGLYSPFHLHRLFKAITGETLNTYVVRKRVERSASYLLHGKEISITEIGFKCGFTSNSAYSRSFKQFYGLSPLEFRRINQQKFSKISQANSKNGQVGLLADEYLCNIEKLKNWIQMNAETEIRDISPLTFIYLTQMGKEGIEDTFNRILSWANSKGLLEIAGNTICRLFHDSFKITNEDKVRMSIGVVSDSPNVFLPEEELCVMELYPGKCFVGLFDIAVTDFEQAWSSMFIQLNEKGLKKADRNPLELYKTSYVDKGVVKCKVELCIPVL